MTINEAIGSLVVSYLPGYRAYDTRGIALQEFLQQQAVPGTNPSVYVSGIRWLPDLESVTDDGKINQYSRELLIYLSGPRGVDADLETLIDALNDPETDGSNVVSLGSRSFQLTTMDAEDQEGDFGFPVIALNIDIIEIA